MPMLNSDPFVLQIRELAKTLDMTALRQQCDDEFVYFMEIAGNVKMMSIFSYYQSRHHVNIHDPRVLALHLYTPDKVFEVVDVALFKQAEKSDLPVIIIDSRMMFKD